MTDPDDDRDISMDTHGFLLDPAAWDAQLAVRMARRLGIGGLSVAHWRVIERLRSGWVAEGRLPVQRHICREADLVPDCVETLFGGLVEAWKVAGLPDPGEEARVYMENMENDDTTE
jgi:dissimilatory sulfite reductase related protein